MSENTNEAVQQPVAPVTNGEPVAAQATSKEMKFCKFCGKQIDVDAILCIHCGKQVEELKGAAGAQPQIIINNDNNNTNANSNVNNNMNPYGLKPKSKWVAFWLAFFLGGLGAHKFYEGKVIQGILFVLFVWTGIPSLIAFFNCIGYLFKPNPYFV
ncbi:MAG: NINE protein [Cellulosilyticaceae bacterium]